MGVRTNLYSTGRRVVEARRWHSASSYQIELAAYWESSGGLATVRPREVIQFKTSCQSLAFFRLRNHKLSAGIALGAPSNAYQSRPSPRTFLFGALGLTNMGATSTLLNVHLDLIYYILPPSHDLSLTLSLSHNFLDAIAFLVVIFACICATPPSSTDSPLLPHPSHPPSNWSFSALSTFRTYTLATDAKPPSPADPSPFIEETKETLHRADS